MNMHDDRPWKAEDMLQGVVEAKGGGAASTRQCIERFFDRFDTAAGEVPTASLVHKADMAAPEAALGADAGPARGQLPTEPPVEVPNHELIRCLGAGGFGQVWLARHALTDHYRACKLIPADKAVELNGLRRLKQRVTSHPNLFPIEEVGSVGEWLYCLMPLAEGASTDQAVVDPEKYVPLTLEVHMQRHGRSSAPATAGIGIELASAIVHLHTHGITHGDIKPANIMRINGRWTLADYGLARELSKPEGGGHTPGYVPPEGPGSTKADQYALGVVLMELLTNWPARMLEDFRQTPVDRFKLDADGPRLAEIILRATAIEPDDRYGSVSELIHALGPLARHEGQNSASAHGRRRWIWPGLALAATVALALGGWLFLPRQQISEPTPPATVAPIAVDSFEVRHYRYDPATDTTVAIGPINADNPAAREGDDVTLHARLSGEGYVYLLSLDADGRVRPRLPASPTEPPAKTTRIDYPSLPTGTPDDILYNLSRGPGTHGFMLLTSEEPLPPWSDWIASRGEPTWARESLPPGGVILFDGRETTYASATRDPVPRRGRLALDPIEWAKAQHDVAATFIAFPVLPSEKD